MHFKQLTNPTIVEEVNTKMGLLCNKKLQRQDEINLPVVMGSVVRNVEQSKMLPLDEYFRL